MSKQEHFVQMIRRGGRKQITVASLLLVTLATILSMSARAWLARASEARPMAAPTSAQEPAVTALPQASATPQPSPSQVEVDAITLYPRGFEPSEITRPTGRFLLLVENYSGIEDIKLQVAVEMGQKLYDVKIPYRKLVGGVELNPPPGQYVITEANHPGWMCRIIITN